VSIGGKNFKKAIKGLLENHTQKSGHRLEDGKKREKERNKRVRQL
jgi:hypothetical protein